MGSNRQIKVGQQIIRELSKLTHDDLAEKYGIVTLTDIDITPDFKIAKIYVSIFEEKYRDDVLKILTRNAKKYQHILGKILRIKFTPILSFAQEDSQSKMDKIDELISRVK